MKLFDKLRRSTDSGSGSGFPEGTADPEAGQAGGVDAGPASSTSPPSPGPSTAAGTAPTTTPDPGRYDPTHPCHAPVAGVDLVVFAQITHRLRVAPAEERGVLLAGQGHTPETWSAVNTVWMARLGQMPYLCATFDEASRLT